VAAKRLARLAARSEQATPSALFRPSARPEPSAALRERALAPAGQAVPIAPRASEATQLPALAPTAASAQPSYSPEVRFALALADEARRSAVLPPRPVAGFASAQLRASAWAADAAAALAGVMPPSAKLAMLGGERALAQVPHADVPLVLARGILSRAGADGTVLLAVIRQAAFLDGFAEGMRRANPAFEMWPASEALVALILGAEHRRAIEAARGSRGGATVAHGMLTTFKYMAVLGWPMPDLRSPVVLGAAPLPKGSRRTPSATLPASVYLHTEWLAAASVAEIALAFEACGLVRSPEGLWCLRFYARVDVLSMVTSARSQDAERIIFFPDERDPSGVVRGTSYLAKDGDPIDLFAPAQGMTGPLTWLPEHLADAARLGQSVPRWTGPRGCASDISKATLMLAEVASKAELRAATYAVWAAPPLCLDARRRAALKIAFHSIHGSWSDLLRSVGEFPTVPFPLEQDLVRGFGRYDCRVMGHWRRDKNAPDDAPPQARGSAPAAPPGAASRRDEMEDLYARGEGRTGERLEQLRVRGRAFRFFQAAMRAVTFDWRSLACDASDWRRVLPSVFD
jgi:hypothetical protein